MAQVTAEDAVFATEYAVTVIRRAPLSSAYLSTAAFSPCCVDTADVTDVPPVTTEPPCCDLHAPEVELSRRRFNVTVPSSVYQSVRAFCSPTAGWPHS